MENAHTTGLFAELLEGAKAVQERPGLIAERDRIKQEAEFHKQRVEDTQARLDEVNEEVANRADKIAKLEAALSDATFREAEVRAKLEALVTSFKHVIGEVKSAADLAAELVEEPKPIENPTANVDGQNLSASTHTADTDATNQGSAQDAQTGSVSCGDAESPFVGQADLSAAKGWSDTSGINPNTLTSHRDHTNTESTLDDLATEWNTPKVTEVARNDGPFASSQEAQSQSAPTPTEQEQSAAPPVRALERKPYWTKPDHTTWREWANSGGDKAPWVSEANLDIAY